MTATLPDGGTRNPGPDRDADLDHWQATWPAAETEACDTWRLRASRGFTKRANSALALPTRRPVEDLLAATTRFYAARSLPPVVVDHDHRPVTGLTAALRSAGWRALPPDPVMTADLAVVRSRLPGADPSADPTAEVTVRSGGPLTEAHAPALRRWFDGLAAAGRDPATVDAAVVLGSPVTVLVTLTDDDGPLAIGRAGISGPWAGLNALWTRPDRRSAGLGRRVIATLVDTARALGADRLQLSVESTNHRARALYERLGFTVRCHYRYWLGPVPATEEDTR